MTNRSHVVAWLLLVSGCSGPSPKPQPAPQGRAPVASDCTTAVDKLFALLARRGHEVAPPRRTGAIEQCRKDPNDPMVTCLLAAADDAAIDKCMTAPKGEPRDQLALIVRNLRTYFFVHETFTDEKLGPIPATPCCQFPTKKCPPETAPDEYWTRVLELDLSKEREFQYRFESSGNKAVIEAVGDRDCDGKTVTYRRVLEWRDDGNMHITVDDPPKGSD